MKSHIAILNLCTFAGFIKQLRLSSLPALFLTEKPKPVPQSGHFSHIDLSFKPRMDVFIHYQIDTNSHISHEIQNIWGILLDSVIWEFLTLYEFVSKVFEWLQNTTKVFIRNIQETHEGVKPTSNDESVANRETEW